MPISTIDAKATNYQDYEKVKSEQDEFPEIPEYNVLIEMKNYEEKFCCLFEIFEKKDADLLTGASTYLQLLALIKISPVYIQPMLQSFVIETYFTNIFTKYTCAFLYLTRFNIKSN